MLLVTDLFLTTVNGQSFSKYINDLHEVFGVESIENFNVKATISGSSIKGVEKLNRMQISALLNVINWYQFFMVALLF